MGCNDNLYLDVTFPCDSPTADQEAQDDRHTREDMNAL